MSCRKLEEGTCGVSKYTFKHDIEIRALKNQRMNPVLFCFIFSAMISKLSGIVCHFEHLITAISVKKQRKFPDVYVAK